MAASAVVGIVGTFVYPLLRRKVGLERTGLFALSTQTACLSLCVLSIWMPGSPFDPFGTGKTNTNCTSDGLNTGNDSTSTTSGIGEVYTENSNVNLSSVMATAEPFAVNVSMEGDSSCERGPDSYLSIGILMAGMIAARFGESVCYVYMSFKFVE